MVVEACSGEYEKKGENAGGVQGGGGHAEPGEVAGDGADYELAANDAEESRSYSEAGHDPVDAGESEGADESACDPEVGRYLLERVSCRQLGAVEGEVGG